MTIPPQNQSPITQLASQRLAEWQIELLGEWSSDEVNRIHSIFETLTNNARTNHLPELLSGLPTTLQHSGCVGTVGRTRGNTILLDDAWSNWTLAHEIGHR